MHKNFGEWYRLVAIEPDGTQLQNRWAGVEAWKTELRKDDKNVLETVRIFQGLPTKASLQAFVSAFQNQDPAFPQRNALELQVLAGAALVDCIQSIGADGKGIHTAIIAGAALDASSLCISDSRLAEIVHEVLVGLQAITVEQRKRKPFVLNAINGKVDTTAKALKQITASGDLEQLKTAVTSIFQTLVDSLRVADRELTGAAHNLQCADEETDILWWVEGACSRDSNKPWATFKEGAAIIAGTELADLTHVALGPLNAVALLERVLSDSRGEDSTLATYINALPEEWVRGRMARANEYALDLTPITRALIHRAKSDDSSWQQYFDASSGLKSSTQIAVTRVAHQAYVEAMLLRSLAEAGTEG